MDSHGLSQPAAAGRGTSLSVRLALAAGGVVAMLALLEGAARLADPPAPLVSWPSARNCLQRSALLGQEFRPDCAGDLSGTVFRTNALGLRGAELRDDGAHRILALGDSCTWGWEVEEADSYPSVLQRVLDARPGGQRYEVINAGTPGYTSHQGLLLLRERLLALRPEIVIIAFGFNDRFFDGDIGDRLARNRTLLPLLQLDDFLSEWSVFYRWARYRSPHPGPSTTVPRVTTEQYERNLTEMIRLVREHGAKPILVSFLQPRTALAIGAYVQAERQVERQLGLPVVGYDGPRLDVVHPTAAGYRGFVDMLVAAMDAAGYLAADKSVTGDQ